MKTTYYLITNRRKEPLYNMKTGKVHLFVNLKSAKEYHKKHEKTKKLREIREAFLFYE